MEMNYIKEKFIFWTYHVLKIIVNILYRGDHHNNSIDRIPFDYILKNIYTDISSDTLFILLSIYISDNLKRTNLKKKNKNYEILELSPILLRNNKDFSSLNLSKNYQNIILLDLIECLNYTKIKEFIEYIKRFLKENGMLFIFLKYKENLKNLIVVCPKCGNKFPKNYHYQQYDLKKVMKLLFNHNFKIRYVQKLNLNWSYQINNLLHLLCSSRLDRILNKYYTDIFIIAEML